MRLIDAEKLILHLNDYALQESPSGNESTGEQRISEMVVSVILNCVEAVAEQPTAFDADAVYRKMWRESEEVCGNTMIELERANEIISEALSGGVE